MALKHSVYDTDAHFKIDPITHMIKNDSSNKNVLIQHDHNSERFTFEIPRMIDGHDMSKCDVVQIHYINIDSQDKNNTSKDAHDVDDLQISPDGDDVVICSWLIDGKATKYAGSLNFLVKFKCIGDDGSACYVWNTAIFTGIFVSPGIDNGEAITEDYSDVLEQWRKELDEGAEKTHYTERVQVLAQTNLEYDEDMNAFTYPEHLHLIAGQEYTVRWNGVEYVCTAYEISEWSAMGLGDFASAGVPSVAPSNEPFAIGETKDDPPVVFVPLDGSTKVTVSIHRDVVHKLDNKYLDLDWIPKKTGTVILPAQIARLNNGVVSVEAIDAAYRVNGTKINVLIDGIPHDTEIHVDGNDIYANIEHGFNNRVMILFSTTRTFMVGKNLDGRTVEIWLDDAVCSKIPVEYLPDGYGSGGNVDQTSPEYYGAVGDGVTDDAQAITQALAARKNVVFDGDKTYAVGSTIVIPADSMVDFRGATIVPLGNHDVIRVKPGSLTENLVVRCTGVSGWDSAAVVLYGGDHFRAYNPTTIKNVKLYNNISSTAGLTTQGVGFKLYGDQFGDFVEGITIEEASTHGFGIGMLFEGVSDDTENTTGGIVFIGANKFRGYWSFYDNRGIVMPNKFPNTHITNNIFTDLQIEPKNRPGKENQSSYGIYCQGFSNYFDGCLYDFFYNHTAVYFGSGSARNVVKTTSNPNYDIDNPVRYVDLGVNNTVTTYNRENADFAPYTATTPRMDGNQDDWFAFIDRRANCTLESFDGEPVSGSLANVFDPTPYKTLVYKTINPDVNNRRARITINCNIAMRRLSNFYMQFYSAPKSIKVTFYNNTDATVVYDTDDNVNEIVGICSPTKFAEAYEYNVAKIVIELGGFSKIKTEGAETYGTWELVRIMAVDSYRTGNVWMRRDGGEMYGNLKFTQDKSVVLTSASGNKFLLTVSDDGTLSTSAYTEEQEEAPEVAVLTPTLLPGASWYNVESSGIAQSEITSVIFDSTYVSTGDEDASWACDEDVNGNIMAYRNGTAVTIKSTTGSDGVKLNADSAYMFANDGTNANFAVLANVGGTDTLRADNKTSASNMFNGNKAITGLIYIPEGVTEMARAFNGCTALTTPPVLPDGLVNLNTAFSGCSDLLELPEIPDTVTNLYYAFMGCTAATKPPSTISAKVTNMSYAFRNCVRLTGTIVIDSTTTTYTNCFQNAGRDTENGIVLTGSSPYLTELAATAGTNGKVTVAT